MPIADRARVGVVDENKAKVQVGVSYREGDTGSQEAGDDSRPMNDVRHELGPRRPADDLGTSTVGVSTRNGEGGGEDVEDAETRSGDSPDATSNDTVRRAREVGTRRRSHNSTTAASSDDARNPGSPLASRVRSTGDSAVSQSSTSWITRDMENISGDGIDSDEENRSHAHNTSDHDENPAHNVSEVNRNPAHSISEENRSPAHPDSSQRVPEHAHNDDIYGPNTPDRGEHAGTAYVDQPADDIGNSCKTVFRASPGYEIFYGSCRPVKLPCSGEKLAYPNQCHKYYGCLKHRVVECLAPKGRGYDIASMDVINNKYKPNCTCPGDHHQKPTLKPTGSSWIRPTSRSPSPTTTRPPTRARPTTTATTTTTIGAHTTTATTTTTTTNAPTTTARSTTIQDNGISSTTTLLLPTETSTNSFAAMQPKDIGGGSSGNHVILGAGTGAAAIVVLALVVMLMVKRSRNNSPRPMMPRVPNVVLYPPAPSDCALRQRVEYLRRNRHQK